MNTFIKKYYPLLFGLLFLFFAYFTLLYISIFQNGNHIVYSLDDAYIHMAMAKNFASDGIWGVSKYEFTSSSSSVLWTTLLAFIYFLFGENEITPLILNLIFASLILVSSLYILKKYDIRNLHISFILISLVAITPLPPLMFTGLEHVLHIWISLLFIYLVTEVVTESLTDNKVIFRLILLASILPLIRYEGIFLVLIASILMILKRKYVSGLLMLVCSLIPIFLFGIISINNGWSFFPNSLLLKGSFPDITSFTDFLSFSAVLLDIFLPGNLIFVIIFLMLVFSVIIYFTSKSRYSSFLNMKITYLILLFLANLILYAAYSKSGWSYRYQSFLVALGIVIFSILLFNYLLKNFRKKIIIRSALIIILFIVPIIYFLILGIKLNIQTPGSSTNIYEQQYQMGKFLKKYYNEKGVALNDIGASNYFADIKCLDLWGLSNLEISQKRRSGKFDSNDIREVSAKYNIIIAIVYDSWFAEENGTIIPSEWVKVGTWKIIDNIIAGDDTISFYAVNNKEAEILAENLKNFSPQLPKTVIESGIYFR